MQYRVHIGADIGKKPDISDGKKRGGTPIFADIGVISGPMSSFSPISVKILTILVVARNGYTPIFGVILEPISA